MRDRKPSPRRLTLEQETTLSKFGNLLTGEPGESVLQTLVRVFGSFEAASAGWFDHRVRLLAEDPVPGRRPAGYWVVEHHREPPPSVEQAAILRGLGELSEREEQQLEEWARMVPETPRDLGLDHPSVSPISLFTEEELDATPEPARPENPPAEAVTGTGTATVEDEAPGAAKEPEPVKENVVTPPRILPMRRGIDDRRPREIEGWETS
jgi:hypothetical protein